MSVARLRILPILRRSRSARTLSRDAIRDEARRRGFDVELVRTGSRGLFWLEPLVEVETAAGRVGYGPVAPGEAAQLFDAGFLSGGAHPKALGRVDDIPYLAKQQRLIFARCGVTDPLSLDDYRRHGGLRGLGARVGARAEGDDRGGSGLGPARARRRRLSDRHQMAHDRRRRGRSEIRRLQRRRRRQRHVRRPHADGGRSLPPDRGHGDRRRLGRRDQGLCLYPLRISARLRDLSAGDRARAGGRAAWPERARLGPCVRSRSAARRRRLYLRRRDVAPAKPRGQARADPRQAASAGDRQACSASRRSSTMC